MKQKNRLSERVTHFARERLIESAGSSIAVPTLMAVGLSGLAVARYAHEVDAENKAAEDAAASASPSPSLAPSFNDPILPPAPQYQPNQREVFVREAVHDVALADLLPPVQPVTDIDWLRPASSSTGAERAYINELADALPGLPSHSAPPVEAEEIPPPPPDNAELEDQPNMPIDENMMVDTPPDNPGLSGGQSAPPTEIEDEMEDEMMAFAPEMNGEIFGGEVAEENWLEVVGTPGVPQSEFANLGILFVPLAVTEERKLADIIFNDEILDADGVTMDPHELFEIRNDNELWLIGGHDLSDGYGINQVYLQFYPRANPSLYISTVVYIQDDPDPNAILNPDDGNDGGNGDEMNLNPNDPNDPNGYDPNDPNGGNMLVPGNEDAFIDEQDYSQPGFEEQEFDYQQGPDII